MREVSCKDIIDKIEEFAIEISYILPDDVKKRLEEMRDKEPWPLAKDTLNIILDNEEISRKTTAPMCQDTGLLVAFVTVGQEVRIVDGSLEDAINEGVRRAYVNGSLRKSVLKDPVLHRENTKDNTPAVIHYQIVPGDVFKIEIAAKGFGSENMSRLAMLKPSDGIEGVKKFIVDTAKMAGPNACPPFILGVGIGGSMEKAAMMAKHSLMRSMDSVNADPEYAAIEDEVLETINQSGIGPQGYGGRTTALKVFIETYPTHIAGLPIAVNVNCHAARHKEIIL